MLMLLLISLSPTGEKKAQRTVPIVQVRRRSPERMLQDQSFGTEATAVISKSLRAAASKGEQSWF